MRHLIRFTLLASVFTLIWACNNQPTGLVGEDQPQSNSQLDKFGASAISEQGEAEFEITLENMTPATGPGASQPFAPPVFASHTPLFHIFKLGKYASDELAQIAEDAVSGPMLEMLDNSGRVYNVAQGDGVVFPGSSITIKIMAKPGFHKLSLVSMLVNTNDAFTGIDALRLPRSGSKTVYLRAYDAGSEKNTEMASDIPGPCCGNPFVRVPSHDRIKHHRGIRGTGDLDPAIYGWEEPVAKLTITRVN